MVLAVGEHLSLPELGSLCRVATGLGGGVGLSFQEMCGALSGGVLLIGSLQGRNSAAEDDGKCVHLSALYREGFSREFGTTQCTALRASGFGSGGSTPCAVLVEQAAKVLLEILDEG